MNAKKEIRILLVAAMLLFALACRVSLGGEEDDADLKLQITLQALQLTQAASSNDQQPAQPLAEQQDTSQDEEDEDEDKDEDEDEEEEDETPCNSSKFVSETIADGTVYDPGDTFEKTWTLRNTGSCDWNEDYEFVFEEGDRMGGENSIEVNTVIEPNETITFKVHLTAPDDPGDYTGVWRLKSDDGEKLGKYWVKINVGGVPAGPFAVTSVSLYMPHTIIDMGCPNDVNVKAEITSNGAGNVTYKWEDSTGGSSSTKSYTFDEAGKKIVEYNVTIGASGDHWANIYIDNPNHQWFGPIDFHVNCTP